MIASAPSQPVFSLIVPTRGRVAQLRRLLASLAETASRPEALEVILVVDDDDTPSQGVLHDRLHIKTVLVPPGQTMGALNMAGYEASSGRYLMLLNDDVVARTPGWDGRILACFHAWPDGIVLIHVNDLIFQDELCTFPAVTRAYCELAGGICPREYERYRIDDHIGDIFNLLTVLGERRTVYLPDVIFAHEKGTQLFSAAEKIYVPFYHSDPAILARDAACFDVFFLERKKLALRLKEHIDAASRRAEAAHRRRLLEAVRDSFSLRVPQRLRTGSDTQVTIGVIADNAAGEDWRPCLEALRSHSTGCELIVFDRQAAPHAHVPRDLNRLLTTAGAGRAVLVWEPVVVGPGWLDRLLGSLTDCIAVVVPPQQTGDGSTAVGVVFHPDGSGHYGPVLGDPIKARLVLASLGPLMLIDRTKCLQRFDETYRRHFFDLDFGLGVWQSGLGVACCSGSPVQTLGFGPLSQSQPLSPEIFDADRRLFAGRWFDSGAYARLEREPWASALELRRLSSMWWEAESLLHRESQGKEVFHELAEHIMRDLHRLPILENALLDRAELMLGRQLADANDPATGHLAWLLGLAGRQPVFVEEYRGYRILLCEVFHAAAEPHETTYICSAATLAELKAMLDAGRVVCPRPILSGYLSRIGTWFRAIFAGLTARVRRIVRKEGHNGLARSLGRRLGLIAIPGHAGRRGPQVEGTNRTIEACRPDRTSLLQR